MIPNLQEFNFCGPEKETCVANQTLKDKICLVPCSGLYADVEDDAFKQTTETLGQNLMKGKGDIQTFIYIS